MEVFGIIGMSFGLIGFIFGLVSFVKIQKLTKIIKKMDCSRKNLLNR
jgi:hypothetical protein